MCCYYIVVFVIDCW